jgi:hypothetical protein
MRNRIDYFDRLVSPDLTQGVQYVGNRSGVRLCDHVGDVDSCFDLTGRMGWEIIGKRKPVLVIALGREQVTDKDHAWNIVLG